MYALIIELDWFLLKSIIEFDSINLFQRVDAKIAIDIENLRNDRKKNEFASSLGLTFNLVRCSGDCSMVRHI